jgi:muramoyltetrapeptide carboxypeptidase
MVKPLKPRPLALGGVVRIVSPASAAAPGAIRRGIKELVRLGYRVRRPSSQAKPKGYFAGPLRQRVAELADALQDRHADAVICVRGGYGAGALLSHLRLPVPTRPPLVVGYSDITVLHAFLWKRWRLATLYGAMVAAGFDKGAGRPGGYDRASFLAAASGECDAWNIPLDGEAMFRGEATGVLLGGCLTLVESTLGTPWELDTRGAILLLEDRAVKPYQLDRMLLHLAQAGKLQGVRGIILNDFPESLPPRGSRVTVCDVCRRLLAPLRVPVVFGAPVGHTTRPMLTLPLGVRARLRASGEGKLEILEPVVERK